MEQLEERSGAPLSPPPVISKLPGSEATVTPIFIQWEWDRGKAWEEEEQLEEEEHFSVSFRDITVLRVWMIFDHIWAKYAPRLKRAPYHAIGLGRVWVATDGEESEDDDQAQCAWTKGQRLSPRTRCAQLWEAGGVWHEAMDACIIVELRQATAVHEAVQVVELNSASDRSGVGSGGPTPSREIVVLPAPSREIVVLPVSDRDGDDSGVGDASESGGGPTSPYESVEFHGSCSAYYTRKGKATTDKELGLLEHRTAALSRQGTSPQAGYTKWLEQLGGIQVAAKYLRPYRCKNVISQFGCNRKGTCALSSTCPAEFRVHGSELLKILHTIYGGIPKVFTLKIGVAFLANKLYGQEIDWMHQATVTREVQSRRLNWAPLLHSRVDLETQEDGPRKRPRVDN